MRTDVKVGLICAFAIVLGLVIYFVVQQNNHPKAALASAQSAASESPSSGAGTPVTPAAATPATAPAAAAPANSPQLLAAAGAPGSVTGPMISPPGAPTAAAESPATEPAATQPTLTGGTPGGTPPPGMYGGAPGGLLPDGSMGTPGPSANGQANPSGSPIGGRGFERGPGFSGRSDSRRSGASATGFTTPAESPYMSAPAGPSENAGAGPSMGGAPLSNSESTGSESTYKIQPHDMLGAIAPRFHTTARAIIAANPGIDPNRLKIGSTLKIPAPSSASSGATMSSPSRVTSSSASRRTASPSPAARTAGKIKPGSAYTVKKGDTLTTISQAAYGTKSGWRRIFRANQGELPSADDVPVGTKLEIPR